MNSENQIPWLIQELSNESLFSDPLSVKRGECLIQPGEVERYLYLVQSGAFGIHFVHEGEEYITRLAYEGDLISALDSFISEGPTDFYVEALRSSEVLKVAKSEYLKFLHANEDRLKVWDNLLMGLVYQQIEREKDLLIPSPRERYQRIIKRSPNLFQEVPLKYIAQYLRMTPETLSRIMKA